MSRSYKKYAKPRHRGGKLKRFCKDYNRYIRHTQPDFVDGAHYRKTNASYHAYDKRSNMPMMYTYYSSRPLFDLDYEETQALLAIGYYNNWSVRHLHLDETYEEYTRNQYKYYYSK